MGGWEQAPDYGSGGKRWSAALAVLTLVLVCAWLGFSALQSARAQQAGSELAGITSVIDGDTLEIHGTHIRLSGIDAPEHDRRCGGVNMGQRAAQALDALTRERTVHCAVSGVDRYGRSVATCTANGADLAATMVTAGWARDWPRYSHRAYANEEQAARNAHRGVWASDCSGLWGNRNYD